MENAANALKIAGGILLAILTISLLVYMVANISSVAEKQAKVKEAKQIKAWNTEWEAYNKKVLYGADVLTVVNKAESEKDYSVNVKVFFSDGTEMHKNEIQNKTVNVFKCIKMETDTSTGRIQNIEFEFVK